MDLVTLPHFSDLKLSPSEPGPCACLGEERRQGQAGEQAVPGTEEGALGARPGWFLSTPPILSEEDILGPEGEAGQGEV